MRPCVQSPVTHAAKKGRKGEREEERKEGRKEIWSKESYSPAILV
jgi:hypothetical protein